MKDYLIKEDVFMALTSDITDCTIEEFIARLRDKLSKLPSVNATTKEDCISRQAVLDGLASIAKVKARSDAQKSLMGRIMFFVEQLPSVTPKEKTGHCKDCKWWKDNDGVYRRGVGAESKCPINRKEVYEGNGYCFLFEQQESENKEVENEQSKSE